LNAAKRPPQSDAKFFLSDLMKSPMRTLSLSLGSFGEGNLIVHGEESVFSQACLQMSFIVKIDNTRGFFGSIPSTFISISR
jgi:hypothetical protein